MPSKIEWTEETWNPVVGCSKVSPGCENCYAIRMAHRLQHIPPMAETYAGLTKVLANGQINWTNTVRTVESRLMEPLLRKKPTRYFVNSMSDLFHEDVPFEFIDKVFSIMALCPQHIFQILTKRHERMKEYCNGLAQGNPIEVFATKNVVERGGIAMNEKRRTVTFPLPNVWLGVSVEDQKTAKERIPTLLETSAAVRWISAEPLLGWLSLTGSPVEGSIDYLRGTKIINRNQTNQAGNDDSGLYSFKMYRGLDWVVVGGESGPNARPMHPEWVRWLQLECKGANVPFFFKQWGEWQDGSSPTTNHRQGAILLDGRYFDNDKWDEAKKVREDQWNQLRPTMIAKVGKKAAGHLLDGVEHFNYPLQTI